MNDAQIAFLLRGFRLKDEPRVGWHLRSVRNPESVADHSWGTALLCMMFAADAGVDEHEALQIALVHDLAEAEIGDIAARERPEDRDVTLEQKAELERDAIDGLLRGVDARLREAWDRYEHRTTDAAVFVRDMNLVDMCLQALFYERERRYTPTPDEEGVLDEFFRSAAARMSSDTGRRLFAAVEGAYRRERKRQQRQKDRLDSAV